MAETGGMAAYSPSHTLTNCVGFAVLAEWIEAVGQVGRHRTVEPVADLHDALGCLCHLPDLAVHPARFGSSISISQGTLQSTLAASG